MSSAISSSNPQFLGMQKKLVIIKNGDHKKFVKISKVAFQNLNIAKVSNYHLLNL